ncbi:MAG: hypothetical protein JHC77_03560 [Opitutales bacterium]|jgi:amino acid transporter|nr:hypothetical protein [Opitutales bacterium]
MTFSLDLTKPLSRVGLVLNLVFLTVVFSAISWLSFGFMTNTLPTSGAHEAEQAIAQKVQDETFSKLKSAAKGKVFDEKAALEEARTKGLEAAAKEAKKIHHEAVELWAPFAIFLLILSAIFFAGFLSIALLRRVNDAAASALLGFIAIAGALAYATFVAFEPFLTHHELTKTWAPAGIIGLVLFLPLFFKGENQSHTEDAH